MISIVKIVVFNSGASRKDMPVVITQSIYRDCSRRRGVNIFEHNPVPEKNPCLQEILSLLDQKETALIGPEGHFISLDSYFGSNKDNIAKIIDDIAGEKVTDEILSNVPKYGFFAGTMFWARLDSLSPILDMYYQASDFEFEDGQIDGTFAHAIERAISLIPQLSAKRIYMSGSGEITEVSVSTENFNRYKYATNE